MSLILQYKTPCDPRVVGVVCDRCKAEVRDEIELQEVVHIRLHAGYGSDWGDGNRVEVDLCDACGKVVLEPFATVSTTSESLDGHVIGAFSTERALPVRIDPADMKRFGDQITAALNRQSPTGWALIWAWVRYSVARYFIPVEILLRPIRARLKAFLWEMDLEDMRLRSNFGLPSRK